MGQQAKYRDVAKHGRPTWSSTNTFPFFFPFGKSTPTGVIIFNFGISNSFSVYTRFFFLVGAMDLVFCCLGGGPFSFLETLLVVFAPKALDFAELLELLVYLETVLDLTVLVGAIFILWIGFCSTVPEIIPSKILGCENALDRNTLHYSLWELVS